MSRVSVIEKNLHQTWLFRGERRHLVLVIDDDHREMVVYRFWGKLGWRYSCDYYENVAFEQNVDCT